MVASRTFWVVVQNQEQMDVGPSVGLALTMLVDHMENLNVEIHLEMVLQMVRDLRGVAYLVVVLKMVQVVAYDLALHW